VFSISVDFFAGVITGGSHGERNRAKCSARFGKQYSNKTVMECQASVICQTTLNVAHKLFIFNQIVMIRLKNLNQKNAEFPAESLAPGSNRV